MRTLVSLDTESGIIRRYSETAGMTHEAALVCDPDDSDKTLRVLQGFRANPHDSFRIAAVRPRCYEDAVSEQIAARYAKEREQEKQLLLGPPSHRDEA